MTRRRFKNEVERAQAIAHIGGYLRDDHTGCETCDAELDLERALDAAVQPKPKARVTPLRRTTT